MSLNQRMFQRLTCALDEFGVLMLTDPLLPSLTTIVAGKAVEGSWWGHPVGNLMYNLSNELLDSPDVLALKFINKKLTFVSKRHWSAVFAVGTANSTWQRRKLLPMHRKLVDLVNSEGQIRADDVRFKQSAAEIGKIASRLEERLLIFSESVHTDSGKHVRVLKNWDFVIRSRKVRQKKITCEEAMHSLEILAEDLSVAFKSKVKLPWN